MTRKITAGIEVANSEALEHFLNFVKGLNSNVIVEVNICDTQFGKNMISSVLLCTEDMIDRLHKFGTYIAMDGSHGLSDLGWTVTFLTVMNSAHKIRQAAVLLGMGDYNANQEWALRVLRKKLPQLNIRVVQTDQRTASSTVTNAFPDAKSLFAAWHFEQRES